MKTVFPSRKSLGLGLFIWSMMLGAFLMTTSMLLQEFDITLFVILLVIWVPTITLIASVWFNTRYIIEQNLLYIKIGPYTEREIEIATINSIKRSSNIIASPANSFKRIEISYHNGVVLLSPNREAEFFLLLQNINPSISIDV